ncbi:MAG: hypothetical protein ACTSPI_00830 [Candidatus Heimdallarchaeaceae archaeon]
MKRYKYTTISSGIVKTITDVYRLEEVFKKQTDKKVFTLKKGTYIENINEEKFYVLGYEYKPAWNTYHWFLNLYNTI